MERISSICGIIAFVLLVVLILTNKKLRSFREKKNREVTVTTPKPNFSNTKNNEMSYKEFLSAGNNQVESSNLWKGVDTDKLVHEDATMVLGAENVNRGARLVRMKTQENIFIHITPFIIGKDSGKCNYCIMDNSTISRVHASFYLENGQLYIVDQRATNGTFVNGRRIPSDSKVLLQSGDTIALSDELFSFY